MKDRKAFDDFWNGIDEFLKEDAEVTAKARAELEAAPDFTSKNFKRKVQRLSSLRPAA